MDNKYKRGLIITGISLCICISFLCFWLGYRNFLNPKLGSFHINRIVSFDDSLYLDIDECHNAIKYVVSVVNQQGVEIYKTESTETKISLKNLIANYGDTLKVSVIAKNKASEEKSAEEILEYPWKYASFVNLGSRYISSMNGLNLNIYGFNNQQEYVIKLEYLNNVIYSEKVTSENINIPFEKISGYAGRITAKLYTKENQFISSYNFFINTPMVGKVSLTSPNDQFRTRWNDVKITFEGGENSTEYHLILTKEGVFDKVIVLPKETKEFIIPANYFEEEKNYQITLEAWYQDYSEIVETDTKSIYVGKKEINNPVYVSHHPENIKSGTSITLTSRTSGATIYYTTDGSIPNESSLVYKEAIPINKNMTIKTYAVSKNRTDSDINTYEFSIGKKDLVVYLSPSNQYGNYGSINSGFSNEMQEMNKITDVIATALKANGVKVYRNKSSGNINEWLQESNNVKSDLHLAIHSNASGKSLARGIEIYVDKQTSKSLSIASNIYKNLYNIYPGKNLPNTNRGVKFADGSLGEANDSFIKSGTLIEIAYHDNFEDAKWMVENREEIGNNIAQSILSYYN